MSLEEWECRLLEYGDHELAGAVRDAVRMLLERDAALLAADV